MQFNGHRYFLTVNAGSSSLKIDLFQADTGLHPVLRGSIQDAGPDGWLFVVTGENGQVLKNTKEPCSNLGETARLFAQWLLSEKVPVSAIGYRIVQGGAAHRRPERINAAFLEHLSSIQSLASTHIPDEIKVIRIFREVFPGLRHIACFDTYFHRSMPAHAKYYPLPRALRKEGVEKYGFHGLSYEYVLHYLREHAPDEANGKIVIAHLGNGASLAAVQQGRSVDTTMGMTPIGGLMMGTRCGDIDPGILLYLLQQKQLSPAVLGRLLSQESGLKGVSGVSADMETLLRLEPERREVAEALDLFCYTVRKMTGAMVAALNGINTLVFTGGIGEHAAAIRNRVCDGLQYLGIKIGQQHTDHSTLISSEASAVSVRVIKTDEAYMIAHHMLHFS